MVSIAMLTAENLINLSRSRYADAKILLKDGSPEGAVYLCGYALELILKRSIVKRLDWDGFPDTDKEFEDYRFLKIHKLNALLHLSGLEKKIMANTEEYARWQLVSTSWDTEMRYKYAKVTKESANNIITATLNLIKFILANE